MTISGHIPPGGGEGVKRGKYEKEKTRKEKISQFFSFSSSRRLNTENTQERNLFG